MDMTIELALEIIGEIEEKIGECCAITMDPDEVEELCSKLRYCLKNLKK